MEDALPDERQGLFMESLDAYRKAQHMESVSSLPAARRDLAGQRDRPGRLATSHALVEETKELARELRARQEAGGQGPIAEMPAERVNGLGPGPGYSEHLAFKPRCLAALLDRNAVSAGLLI